MLPHWIALALAAALVLGAAALEQRTSGSDFPAWMATLRRPRLFAPLWVWVVVALITYLMQGIVAYRLFSAESDNGLVWAALGLLVVEMGANVAYNLAAVRTRDPRTLFTGLLGFGVPLVLLQLVLIVVDPTSALLHAGYLIWVLAYDVPIMRATWLLNRA